MSDVSKKVPRQGEPEQRMTGNQSLNFPSCTIKRCCFFSCELERSARGVYTESHNDRYGGSTP